MSDLVLQDLIGRQADRVAGTLGFKKFVDLGIGKGCVTSKIQMLHDASVTCDYRLQHRTPTVGTMDVARSQRTPFDIAELVEHEQRVVAGTGKMPVVSAAFLLTVGRALARIHIKYDGVR